VTWQPGERSDVANCLKILDILCLPSLAEGISNAVLEAMASGLPVVATRVGGNAELVDDGASGFLVASGEAAAMADRIEQYFGNKSLLKGHSSAARQRAVMQFSLPSMVERYHQVYARLLSQGT
jgi:glycosyltransferase involved in cell wall biosynthesis